MSESKEHQIYNKLKGELAKTEEEKKSMDSSYLRIQGMPKESAEAARPANVRYVRKKPVNYDN